MQSLFLYAETPNLIRKFQYFCAILFGSYGKRNASKKSDVDLLVDSGLHGLKFIGLGEEIRAALDKEVDLFDVSHIEPASRIEKEIGRNG